MTQTQYLLTVLAEECVDTAQRASKGIRFTLDEVQAGQDFTNAERIVYEFNDIVAVMEILVQLGELPIVIDRAAIDLKKEKIRKWLDYSKSLGTVTDEQPTTSDNK